MNSQRLLFWVQAAGIAALYVVLTFLSGLFGLAVGLFEFRLSEGLCILPVFTPAAVPGLFAGCFLANLFCGGTVWDAVLGSLATLLGALFTRYFRKKKFLPLFSPVFFNSLIVPPVLYFLSGVGNGKGFFTLFLLFFAGEFASVFLLGIPLKKSVEKTGLFTDPRR